MKQYDGRFVGRVDVVWNEDGRTMTLTQPFAFVDPAGVEWLAPAGSTVDGASIPQFAWSFIGGPFEGKYRKASVIHDVACDVKEHPWEQAHEAFYYAMRTAGVGNVKAEIMYAAVYHFGPRWPSHRLVRTDAGTQRLEVPAPQIWMTEEQFDDLKARIKTRATSGNPITLVEIRDYQPPTHKVPGTR